MTAVNCPMCELRFATRTERDWHLRNEHQHVHVHGPTNRPVAWTGHPAPSSGPAPDQEQTRPRRRSGERPVEPVTDLRPLAEGLVEVARWAPSLHNAQPWAFRVGAESVEVVLDRSRVLPVADPTGRQAYLGVGAAVFLLRLKLSTLDQLVRVEPWPDPAEPDLVARLVIGGRRSATDAEPPPAHSHPRPPAARPPTCYSRPDRTTGPTPARPGSAAGAIADRRSTESGPAAATIGPAARPRPGGAQA